MERNISKTYEQKEKEIYSYWEDCGLFNPDNMEKYLKEKGLDIKNPLQLPCLLQTLMVTYI